MNVERMRIRVNVLVKRKRRREVLEEVVEVVVGVARRGGMIYLVCPYPAIQDLIRRMEEFLNQEVDCSDEFRGCVKTAYTDVFSATWDCDEGLVEELIAFVAVVTAVARLFKVERVRARLCDPRFDWDGPAYKLIGLPAYVFIEEGWGHVFAVAGRGAREVFKRICSDEDNEHLEILHEIDWALGDHRPNLYDLSLLSLIRDPRLRPMVKVLLSAKPYHPFIVETRRHGFWMELVVYAAAPRSSRREAGGGDLVARGTDGAGADQVEGWEA